MEILTSLDSCREGFIYIPDGYTIELHSEIHFAELRTHLIRIVEYQLTPEFTSLIRYFQQVEISHSFELRRLWLIKIEIPRYEGK